jgi:hypothetical protein
MDEKILNLPTPRLLAYYKKHYRGGNPYTRYYLYEGDEAAAAQWDKDCEAIKTELNTREHVEK